MVSGAPARRVARRHAWRGVLVYLALAFGLAWASQIALAAGVRAGVSRAPLGGGALVVALLLMWPPAIGALVARRWVEGDPLVDGFSRPRSWGYLLLAWLGPPLLTGLALLISLPLYPLDTSFSTLRALAEQAGQPLAGDPSRVILAQLALALTLAVPINSAFALGEELG